MTLSQGRIERFLIDAMEEISDSKLQVERGVVADAFAYDGTQEKNPNGYPIELVLRTLSDSEANPEPAHGSLGGRDNIAKANLPRDETGYTYSPKQLPGTVERVRTKYLIGCDGARSWLRNQLKYKMEGASTTTTWYALAFSLPRNLCADITI
jgi:phenol 2-monooxygenase